MNFQKSIGFTMNGFFKHYEKIVRRCGHFQKIEISDPKSQNFQNLENLKNHVFGVFRWICQEKKSVIFFDRFFF